MTGETGKRKRPPGHPVCTQCWVDRVGMEMRDGNWAFRTPETLVDDLPFELRITTCSLCGRLTTSGIYELLGVTRRA